MAAHSDLTFITNENGQNLLERFKVLIKDTEFFDVLVGYFYTSGFHALYQALKKNKQAFIFATTEEDVEFKAQRGGSDSTLQVLKILKAVRDFRQYTEEQEAYLKRVMNRLEEGALPKQTAKTVLKALGKEPKTGNPNPLKVLALLPNNVPDEFLEGHIAESATHTSGPREVILSEYLMGGAEQ